MKIHKLFLGVMFLISTTILNGDDLILVGDDVLLDGLNIGNATMAGSGCSQGSVGVVLDETSKDLLVVFDDYMVETWGNNRVARKNCSLSIPLELPTGVQVTLIGTRLEGFNYLPDGATSVLNSESFIPGTEGKKSTETFEGSLEEDFVVENAASIQSQSACGGSVNLRLNTSLRVRTNSYGDYALAGITAMGVDSASLVQKLKFTKCSID
jgi:hypothetical protein